MASYRKRGNSWRVEIAHKGVRLSATFETKSQAQAWAAEKEAALRSGRLKHYRAPGKTLAEALDRYGAEVSPTKKGAPWEKLRIVSFKVSLACADDPLADIRPEQLAQWRDHRLKQVKPSTVNREMNLLSSVLETARREWAWLAHNPLTDVRRPVNPRPRERRISEEEELRMLRAFKFEPGQRPQTVQHHLAAAFLFALETGMRQGEILGLTWDRVCLAHRYVRLLDSKNGDRRNIPLSTAAIAILTQQPRNDPSQRCFLVTSRSADALWRKARQRAQLTDLHFHDTRHEAITRLAKKLDVLDLARMIGHRDLRSLMIYYHATATELAERLG